MMTLLVSGWAGVKVEFCPQFLKNPNKVSLCLGCVQYNFRPLHYQVKVYHQLIFISPDEVRNSKLALPVHLSSACLSQKLSLTWLVPFRPSVLIVLALPSLHPLLSCIIPLCIKQLELEHLYLFGISKSYFGHQRNSSTIYKIEQNILVRSNQSNYILIKSTLWELWVRGK